MQAQKRHTRHFPPLAWSRSGSKGPSGARLSRCQSGSPSGQLIIVFIFELIMLTEKAQ